VTDYLLVRHAPAESDLPEAGLTPQGRSEADALARRLRGCTFDAAWSSDLERAAETAKILLAGRTTPELLRSPLLREVPPPDGLLAGDPAGYGAWEREAIAGLAERLSEWLSTSFLKLRAGTTSPRATPAKAGVQVTTVRTGPWMPAQAGMTAPTTVRYLGNDALSGCSKPKHASGTPANAAPWTYFPMATCLGTETDEPTILVVSHAGPLRVLTCLLLGLPPDAHWAFRFDRASISIVRRGADMGTLLLLNDRCHLEGVQGGCVPLAGCGDTPHTY
jgi:broad specificity phosphatase PhoE